MLYAIIWAALAILIFMEYAEMFEGMRTIDKIICFIIIIMGAPVFTLNNILTYILDIFMPEDWDK